MLRSVAGARAKLSGRDGAFKKSARTLILAEATSPISTDQPPVRCESLP